LNDVDVGSSTNANGDVIFTYGAYNYSLDFDVTYAADGTPNPFQFSGTRTITVSGTTTTDTVTGTQVIPQPPQPPVQDWASKPGWSDTDTIITIFGGGIPMTFGFIKWVLGKKKVDEYKENIKKFLDHIFKTGEDVAGHGEAAANPQIVLLRDRIMDAIREAVATEAQSQPDIMHPDMAAVSAAAAKQLSDTIVEIYMEQRGSAMLQNLLGFSQALSPQRLEQLTRSVIAERMQNVPLFADPGDQPLVNHLAQAEVSRLQAAEYQEVADEAHARHDSIQDQVAEEQQEVQNDRSEVVVEQSKEREDINNPDLEQEDQEEEARLDRVIDNLNRQVSEAEKQAQDASDAAAAAAKNEQDHEQQEHDAEDAGNKDAAADHLADG
jgi:hypothetical protein